MNKDLDEVLVRFQFKDDKKIIRAKMTKKQLRNFKIIPIIKICEVVTELDKEILKDDEEELRKKLEDVLNRDTSHIKNIAYD